MAAAAKADTLKEEYEEETAKFEACQVSNEFCILLTDFFPMHLEQWRLRLKQKYLINKIWSA